MGNERSRKFDGGSGGGGSNDGSSNHVFQARLLSLLEVGEWRYAVSGGLELMISSSTALAVIMR